MPNEPQPRTYYNFSAIPSMSWRGTLTAGECLGCNRPSNRVLVIKPPGHGARVMRLCALCIGQARRTNDNPELTK